MEVRWGKIRTIDLWIIGLQYYKTTACDRQTDLSYFLHVTPTKSYPPTEQNA
jgi:hypothetical protein